MGAVYRQQVTKPLPRCAEIIDIKGKQWARWKDSKGKTRKAPVATGRDGSMRIVIESRTYTAKYRDGAGIIRTVPTGCRDEQAARSVLADLERRAELVKSGVMTKGEDAAATHQGTPLQEHFDAYSASMRARELSGNAS